MYCIVYICLFYLELINGALNTTYLTEVQQTTFWTNVTSQYNDIITATPASSNSDTTTPENLTTDPTIIAKPTIDSPATTNTMVSSQSIVSNTPVYQENSQTSIDAFVNNMEESTLPNLSKDVNISTIPTTEGDLNPSGGDISKGATYTTQNTSTEAVGGYVSSSIVPQITKGESVTSPLPSETTTEAVTPAIEATTAVYEAILTDVSSVSTRANTYEWEEVMNYGTSDEVKTSNIQTSTPPDVMERMASDATNECTCPSTAPTQPRIPSSTFDPVSFIIGFIIPAIALIALSIKFYFYHKQATSQTMKLSEQSAYQSFDVTADHATSPTISEPNGDPVWRDLGLVERSTRPMSMIVNRPKSVFAVRPKSMYGDTTMTHYDKDNEIPMTSFLN